MSDKGNLLSSIRHERDRFVAFSFAAADMLAEINAETGEIFYLSGAARSVTGLSADEVQGSSLFNLLLPSDRVMLQRSLLKIKNGGRLPMLLLRMARSDGEAQPVIVGGCHLQGHEHYYISFVLAKKLLSEWHADEIRDDTTGLLDASSFSEKAKEALHRASEDDDYNLTMLDMSDLEGMLRKASRDQVEEFWLNVGAYLRASSVDGDTAGKLEENRYGIVHDKSLSDSEIRHYLEELGRSISGIEDVPSIKAAAIDLKTEELGAHDTAKALLYSINKFAEQGAENFTLHSLNDSINDLMHDTVKRVKNLKSVVSGDSFDIHFQPIVSLPKREMHHFEALSRFKGDKSPFQVIAFAEQVGMVQEFDLAVCQKVLAHMQYMEKNNKKPFVAVNLSAQSMESAVFIATVRDLFAEHPSIRKQVLFELTESSNISDFSKVNQVLQTLRRDGHMVCLDDVGAGATSFEYLRALQVDYIKIDGSYVRSMLESNRDKAFTQAIAALGKSLKIKTIAEMVESASMEAPLIEMGVDYAQGYFYGKPSQMLMDVDFSKIPL